MKGLFLKDLYLIKSNIGSVFILVALSIWFAVVMENPIFALFYITLISVTTGIGTLSRDERENSLNFFLTLPVTVKSYVKEKFAFCISVGSAALLFLTAVITILKFGFGFNYVMSEILTTVLFAFLFLFIATSLMLAFQFKFGVERMRTIGLTICGLIAAAAYILSKFTDDSTIMGFANKLLGLNKAMLAAAVFAISLVVLLCSVKYSIKTLSAKFS
ncbi:MAG: ABC-2 transporter permease [Clostridia bacterium]|nr:ABC-2 transporter permease [Clostridia bacterium]